MTETFSDSFFDKVDGAKDGRCNGTLEMKELREALCSPYLSQQERKLAGMVLDEYDLAKSLVDGGGQISRQELALYVDMNRGRLEQQQNLFSSSNVHENRRAYLSNLMDRINFNFSKDNDDNRYLTRDELRTALNSGHDKRGEPLSHAELELVETLYLNWKRDIKNVSEKKGEDNDGISVYDLFALAERRPRKFSDISDMVNQTYRSALPQLTLEQEPPSKCRAQESSNIPQIPPQERRNPLPPERQVPLPPVEIPPPPVEIPDRIPLPPEPVPFPPEEPRIPVPVPRVWINQGCHRLQHERFRLGEECGRAAREIEILIIGTGIRFPGRYHTQQHQHDHHRQHRNYDYHPGPRCELPKWQPSPGRDNYNFHQGRRK